MRTKKRGQVEAVNAAGATTLILIILAGILLYVLLVPPEVREELLKGNFTDEDSEDNGDEEAEEVTLLDEQPGRLDYIDEREYEHNIPSFYIYKTTNSVELKKTASIATRSAVFDRYSASMNFQVGDLENTGDAVLTFLAEKHEGILTITLNGQQLFMGDINTYNPAPITLPKALLSAENLLTFEVSDVGWRFWLAHEYILQNVRVIAQVTDVSRQEAKNVFYITDVEHNNLERSTLKFLPECNPNSAGKLDVTINYQNVFSGIPDCGILNVYEFAPSILESGSNRVIFKTDSGNYLIDRVTIKTQLKDSPEVTYYFTIDAEQYDDILKNRLDCNLSLEFVEQGPVKEGKLVINGKETGFYTRERVYSKVLDAYIQQGNNAIKVVPKTTLEIINLFVKLED
ncbi:hypothetical protein KY320_03475 [Candidatus Woesearchaeota archaeon]|nr:hypothetical protein [Candidatus Woesearchaeota archaeon]